jgi:hypothetical protein
VDPLRGVSFALLGSASLGAGLAATAADHTLVSFYQSPLEEPPLVREWVDEPPEARFVSDLG